MSYAIKNVTGGDYTVGGVKWALGETKTLITLNKAIQDQVDAGINLTSVTDVTPLGGLTDLVNTSLTTITNTTGTPVAPTAGALTLAAITDVPTAANAIATLAVEINRLKTFIGTMCTRVNIVTQVLADADRVLEAKNIAG